MTRSLLARLLAVLLPASALLAGEGRAQGWALDAAAGQIVHEAFDGSFATLGATLGFRHDGPRWAYLSGGIPFDSAGPTWGALGLGGRFATGSRAVAVGADVGGQGYAFRDPLSRVGGGGTTLEAMPLLALAGAAARLELRSGVLYHGSTFAGGTSWRAVHQSDARLSLGTAAVQVVAEGRHVRAADGRYPYAGAGAEAVVGGGTVWGYAGKWLSDSIQTPAWGAGGRLPLAGRTEVFASVQQETNDPLYRIPPRRSWSVGVTHRLGRGARAALSAAAPLPAPVGAEVRAGRVTFRVPLSVSAQPPAVGGDFTRWEAVPLARHGDSWSLTLPVPQGVYRYAFRTADGVWFVPESVPGRMDDGFGGVVATLIVP